MYSYHTSVAASLAKRMFWMLTAALKDDLFPESGMFFSSFDSNVVFEVISGKGPLKITRYTG